MCAQQLVGKATAKDQKLAKLMKKVQEMDLGASSFWKPPEGRSTFRILPPIGKMEFFFQEVGQHYVGNQYFYCPTWCNDNNANDYPCPICELNEALYAAGEKEAAGEFRVGRKWYLNIVERGVGSNNKPQIFAAGQGIMQVVISLVGDEDYGDISDPLRGWDIKVDRTGKAKETKYTALPASKPSILGTPEEIAEILAGAKDLNAYVMERVLAYDVLIVKSGVEVYIEGNETAEEDGKAAEEEESEEELLEEEEEEVPAPKPTASSMIANRLKARGK